MHIVSITSQGQISIPAKIRKELGLLKFRKAVVFVDKGKLIVEPVKDFLELGGSLKSTKRPLSSEDIHEMFAKGVTQKYAGNNK